MATYAVMQSRVDYSGHFTPHLLPSKATSRDNKPKLSLNTSPHRSFGRASTGLRLDTLSPSSPTRTNTYHNSYDPQAQLPHGEGPVAAKTLQKPKTQFLDGQSPHVDVTHDNIEDKADVSRHIPYSLPPNTRSILTNGPLNKRQRPLQTPVTSTSTTFALAPSPPPEKRVCFRDPVCEEIQTTQYLLKHSDLRSRSTSPAPDSREAGSAPVKSSLDSTSSKSPYPLPPKAREVAPKLHLSSDEDDQEDERESHESDEESNTLPKTPVAGRNKKDREWVWTLGPVPGVKEPGSSILSDYSSDEDLDDSLGETVAAASGFL